MITDHLRGDDLAIGPTVTSIELGLYLLETVAPGQSVRAVPSLLDGYGAAMANAAALPDDAPARLAWAPVAVWSVVMKKSSGSIPSGSRTMTSRSRSRLLTVYQSTWRTRPSRGTVRPRSWASTCCQSAAWAVVAISVGGAQPLALGAGPAASAGARQRGLVECGVAADPAGEVGAGQAGAAQRGVGAVPAQVDCRPGSQPASSRSIAAACSTVLVVSFLRCSRALTGSAIGGPPHGGVTRRVSTTRFSPSA